jgi:hypothetical protein
MPSADPISAPPLPVESPAPAPDLNTSVRQPDAVAKTEGLPDLPIEQQPATETRPVERPAEPAAIPPVDDEQTVEPDPVAPLLPAGPQDRADSRDVEPPAIETERFTETLPPERIQKPASPDATADLPGEPPDIGEAAQDILQPTAIASLAALETDVARHSPSEPAAETGPRPVMSFEPNMDREPAKSPAEPEHTTASPEPVQQPETQPAVSPAPAEIRPVDPTVSTVGPPPTQSPIQVFQSSHSPPPPVPEPRPTVQIGQIDVVVAEPETAQPVTPAPSRLAAVSASRRYLRRL